MTEPCQDQAAPGLPGDLAAVSEVLDRASVAVGLLAADGAVRYTNESFARACGRPGAELLGARLTNAVLADDRVALRASVQELTAGSAVRSRSKEERGDSGGGVVTGTAADVRFIGADGRVRPTRVDMALLTGELATALSGTGDAGGTEPTAGDALVMCIVTDRSAERRSERSDRRRRVTEATAAMTDPVTGLLNDRGMDLTLESASRRAGRNETAFAFIHCTISQTAKAHAAADTDRGDAAELDEALLMACVERIRQRLRPSDSVARTGDAVVVVAEDLGDEQDAAGVTYRILSTVIEPVMIDDEPIALEMRAATVVADGSTPVHRLAPAAAEAATRAVDDQGFELVDLRRRTRSALADDSL